MSDRRERSPCACDESPHARHLVRHITRLNRQSYETLFACAAFLGDRVLDVAMSPLVADAIARGTGRLECHVVARSYLHCAPVIGTA
jgi:hypothetical protein